MINNRQNGRRRGRGGARPQNGSPSGQQGSRIDNRARGNAAQLHEKYKAMARDAQMQGDRVMTEYYHQFADHYFRILLETRPRFEEQQGRDRNDGQDDGYDGEDMLDEQQPRRDDQPRREEQGGREDQPRRDDRPRRDDGYRDSQPRAGGQDRYRDDRPRRDDARRDDARREDPRRDDRPFREEGEFVRAEGGEPLRPRRIEVVNEPAPVIALDAAREGSGDETAPRRRGRPRRVDAAPVNGANGAAHEERIEEDRLPPSVSREAQPVASDGDDETPRPRRGRRPRSAGAAAEA